MKIYHSKQFGFEMKVPKNWPLPVRVGPEGLVFMNLINECFNFQIGPLYPERLTHDTEALFKIYARSQGHTDLEFGRIRARNRNHVWARYNMGDGLWTKKYMLVIGFVEYAITGTCPDKETFLKREPVWDSMVESFRITESQEQYIRELQGRVRAVSGPQYQKAYEAVGDERFSDARDILEQCLLEDPDNALAHKELAFVLRQMGDLTGALNHRREVKRLDPSDKVNRYNISIALHLLGEKKEALRETEELLKIEPYNPLYRAHAATLIEDHPFLIYPKHYDEESQQQPGKKSTLKLMSSTIKESEFVSFLTLVYQWEEALSEQDANTLSRRAIAYVSCAIFDAATAGGLSCKISEIQFKRPSWLIDNQKTPISVILSDIDYSNKIVEMNIGARVAMIHPPSSLGTQSHETYLVKLQIGFKEKFSNITV